MIDVVVTSTCRKQFKSTYRSFMKKVKCSEGYRFIVHIDVLPENRNYLPVLLKFLEENNIGDVLINNMPGDFANSINYLLRRIETDYYFHLEDDWLFLKEIELDPLIDLMRRNEEVNQIRFSKEQIIQVDPSIIEEFNKRNELFLLPGEQATIDGINLIKSYIWSLNPHIARLSVVRKLLDIPSGINPENYFCKKYSQIFNSSSGLYIYGMIGESPYVKDIGRLNIVLRKTKMLYEIMKNPSLISKKKRIEKDIIYRGQNWDGEIKVDKTYFDTILKDKDKD
jgi:hypothetical protein